MVGKRYVNYLILKGIYQDFAAILRHPETFHYTFPISAGSSRVRVGNVYRGMGMREWLLLTTIMVLGFACTLGKLAYDEWRIKRSHRNHGASS
jgi:hypothetical protein